MSEQDHDVDELDRLWNDLLTGHTDATTYAVDPADLDALQAFHALVPVPPSASLARLDQAIHAAIHQQAPHERAPDAWHVLTVPTLALSANGSGKPVALGITPSASHGLWPSFSRTVFVIAALVLLMVGVGLVGMGGWSRSYPSDAGLVVIPAIEDPDSTGQAAATPSARRGYAETSLLDITLPAATLGRQSGAVTPKVTWIYTQYRLDPGQQVVYPEACAAPDFVVRYVLQGSYAAKALGPMQIMRHAADGGRGGKSVPPGQEVVLYAGDALLYHNIMGDQFQGFRNAGADEVELLDWQWLEDDCLETIPTGMQLRWDAFPGSDVTNLPLPFDTSRPLRLWLRKLDVPPGSDVPQDGPDGPGLLPPGFPGDEVAAAIQGHVRVTDTAPKEELHLASSDMPPPGGLVSGAAYLPVDSQRTVQSSGDEPLHLYTLTIVNASASGSATPAAATQEAPPMG